MTRDKIRPPKNKKDKKMPAIYLYLDQITEIREETLVNNRNRSIVIKNYRYYSWLTVLCLLGSLVFILYRS